VKRKLFKIYLAYGLAGLFLLFGLSVLGQRSNPFEIIPRLGEVEQQPVLSVDSGSLVARSNNPFDIVSDPVKAENNNIKTIFPPVETPVLPKGDSSVFRFILVVFILSMVAFLLTILRSVAVKSFSAFLNNNMLNQLYREQEGRGVSPFVLLYVMFLMNVGIFLYFCMDIFDVRPINNEIGLFFLCLGASFGLFLGKHLLLSMISFIFPVKKEVSRYHFLMIIYGIIIGFLMVPFNLFLAFGPETALRNAVFILLVLIGLAYAYRYFRAMAIASKFLVFHKFHFVLYICTIEIMPAIIILKIAQSGI
jgi:hypothetical protein